MELFIIAAEQLIQNRVLSIAFWFLEKTFCFAMLVFNLPINPMYLISLEHCSLIKIINDQILYQLSQHKLENLATVRLLVLISILCFTPQCSKGPIA